MKKLYLLISVILMSFLTVGMAMAAECGSSPTVACTISVDTTFNEGHILNISTGTAITFNSGAVLNFNGGGINCANGSGTKGIDMNFNTGSIENGSIISCATGIYGSHPDNVRVYNNTIKNYSFAGIRSLNSGGWEIRNNNIYNDFSFGCANGSGTYADYFECYYTAIIVTSGNDYDNIIAENTIYNSKYGIQITENKHRTQITNNNIWGIGTNGYNIILNAESNINWTNITNNNLTGGWNTISNGGQHTVIENNYIYNWFHHGIGTLINEAIGYTGYSTNLTIKNNILNHTPEHLDPSFNVTPRCLFLEQIQDSNIYENTCIGGVISYTGNASITKNNNIYNNFCINCNQTAYYILGNASLYNNSATNTNEWNNIKYDYYLGTDYDDKITLTNIILTNNTGTLYYFETGNTNISIDNYLPINATWGGTGGKLNQSYTGIKQFFVENKTSYLTFTSPYDDVYNVSSASFLAYNQTTYALLIEAGGSYLIKNSGGSQVCTPTQLKEVTTSNLFMQLGVAIALFLIMGFSVNNILTKIQDGEDVDWKVMLAIAIGLFVAITLATQALTVNLVDQVCVYI